MTKQVSMIAATASQVATAYAAHVAAGETLSVAKFDAIVNFAASVATRLRVEYIAEGSNLETKKGGELVALLDLSKQQRDAFATAFVKAGIGEKDAANIASMGRTVARHFVNRAYLVGPLHTATSGDELAQWLREQMLLSTGGVATYNALEKARADKWQEPQAEADAPEADAPEADAPEAESKADVDLSATLPSVAEPTHVDPLQADVQTAINVLRNAVHGEAWDVLQEAGFGAFIIEARKAWQEAVKAEAEAAKAIANA